MEKQQLLNTSFIDMCEEYKTLSYSTLNNLSKSMTIEKALPLLQSFGVEPSKEQLQAYCDNLNITAIINYLISKGIDYKDLQFTPKSVRESKKVFNVGDMFTATIINKDNHKIDVTYTIIEILPTYKDIEVIDNQEVGKEAISQYLLQRDYIEDNSHKRNYVVYTRQSMNNLKVLEK